MAAIAAQETQKVAQMSIIFFVGLTGTASTLKHLTLAHKTGPVVRLLAAAALRSQKASVGTWYAAGRLFTEGPCEKKSHEGPSQH